MNVIQFVLSVIIGVSAVFALVGAVAAGMHDRRPLAALLLAAAFFGAALSWITFAGSAVSL